ncbi:DUF6527 family protein [Beijerinckia sp. L45]|uniref:DUF6527 family protein n=1 Tax=Beijerinckia sp. L45 TaxID=1641855 RepID=UPI0034CFAD86
MACPRGRCSSPLNLNLMPDDHPMWTLQRHNHGLPSLAPSVWRKHDCGCHFWLRRGEVVWCD